MNVPSLPTVITGNKSGTCIKPVDPAEAVEPESRERGCLNGILFYYNLQVDNLTNVGSYVPGSFKIGNDK